MKRIILFASVICVSVVSALVFWQFRDSFQLNIASKIMAKDTLAKISFKEMEFDYGKIKKGSNGGHEFIFENDGNVPLVITNVTTSCGCTAPEWSKEPVKPKEKSKIKVVYDTNRIGAFSKTISVYSNADEHIVTLTIKGVVEE